MDCSQTGMLALEYFIPEWKQDTGLIQVILSVKAAYCVTDAQMCDMCKSRHVLDMSAADRFMRTPEDFTAEVRQRAEPLVQSLLRPPLDPLRLDAVTSDRAAAADGDEASHYGDADDASAGVAASSSSAPLPRRRCNPNPAIEARDAGFRFTAPTEDHLELIRFLDTERRTAAVISSFIKQRIRARAWGRAPRSPNRGNVSGTPAPKPVEPAVAEGSALHASRTAASGGAATAIV